MTIEDEGFEVFSHSEGKMQTDFGGEHQEIEYHSRNHINSRGTIGYAEIESDGIVGYIFLSRTPSGEVLTMPAEMDGPVPFPVDGFKAICTVKGDSPIEHYFSMHLKAIGGEALMNDEEGLKQAVQILPQRIVDIVVLILEKMAEAMERGVDIPANAFGGRVVDDDR